jgi:hypothetical protein
MKADIEFAVDQDSLCFLFGELSNLAYLAQDSLPSISEFRQIKNRYGMLYSAGFVYRLAKFFLYASYQ